MVTKKKGEGGGFEFTQINARPAEFGACREPEQLGGGGGGGGDMSLAV